MHEHHWWLICKGGERTMRCSACGAVEKADDPDIHFTVTLVEGDDED